MPSTQQSEHSNADADVISIAVKAAKHRRYAQLFARAMTEPSKHKRAATIAEIGKLLRSDDE